MDRSGGGGGGGLRRRGGGGDAGLSSSDDKPRKGRITLESFDIYQKVQPDEAVQTTSGATVTVVALAVVLLLLLSELSGVFFPARQEHMAVDQVIEGRLRINFDISLHALACSSVNLDAMDVAGEQQNGLDHDVVKTRLDGATGLPIGEGYAARIGNATATAGGGDHGDGEQHHAAEPTPLPADYCGSCYGAGATPTTCCNTCDDVRNAYVEKGWEIADVTRNSEQCVREKKNP
jgi:hypothetical protein